MNINNRKFKTIQNKSGLSSSETVFHYHQEGTTITGTYKGGAIVEGFVVGKQVEKNRIELLFQCLTDQGELMAGESKGVVSENESGKLELRFDWTWLNGDRSGGKSEYMEVE